MQTIDRQTHKYSNVHHYRTDPQGHKQDIKVNVLLFVVNGDTTCKVIKINSLNDGDAINQHHCQVIIK